jgi:hypothetical protein
MLFFKIHLISDEKSQKATENNRRGNSEISNGACFVF